MKKYIANELPIKKITHKKREYYLAEDAEKQFSEYASVLIMLRRQNKLLVKALKGIRKINPSIENEELINKVLKL